MKTLLLIPLLVGSTLVQVHAASKEATQVGASPTPDAVTTQPGVESARQSPKASLPDKEAFQAGAQRPVSGRTFVEKAIPLGLAEVEFSRLAIQRASHPAVKQFAETMVSDHTEANERLLTIAAAKDIEVERTPDGKHRQALKKLSALEGPAFDKSYIDQMVSDHEAAVALFQDGAANGSDGDLKAFAASALPKLERHLDHAIALQEKVE